MKQLESDPWDGIGEKYPIESKITGRVTNITDYGAFVELEPGVEGLVHVSGRERPVPEVRTADTRTNNGEMNARLFQFLAQLLVGLDLLDDLGCC